MYKKIKKIPSYFSKLKNKKFLKEFSLILEYVCFKDILIALAGRLENRSTCLILKNGKAVEINDFLNTLKFRLKRISNDICLWKYENEKVYGNYEQFLGLKEEYFSGAFNNLYKFDMKNKKIIDIGGFVGDSALYFLKNGAKEVLIYEPISKNIQAMNLNLQDYKDKIEIHQKALAPENGLFTLFSSLPEGSNGFGAVKGDYQVQCDGIKIADILSKHSDIDIVKVDCEGGEEYLLGLDSDQMKSVTYWVVETHTLDLHKKIKNKFKDSGFSITSEIELNSTVSLMHFKC